MYAGEDRELENQLLVTRGFLFPSQIRNFKAQETNV